MEDFVHSYLAESVNSSLAVTAPFSENLFHALDLLLEYRSDHELFVKLAQEVRDVGTPQAQEAIKKLENVVLDYLRQHLDQAIAEREVRECDTQVTSFMLVKLYIALTSEWNRSRETLSKEQIKNHIWLFVSEGLIVKGSD